MMRVAIIGFGWWGRHMLSRLLDSSVVQPVAVVEPVPTALAGQDLKSATLRTYDEVLSDPEIDGVILTVPNAFHEEYSVKAARAGKHVFCEKPLALHVAAARVIVDTCAREKVVLGIGHERRFEPGLMRVAQLVADGALGKIMHVEAAFSHDKLIDVPADDWRTKKRTAPGGGMTATGIHLTDLFIWMFGRIDAVSAVVSDRVLGWETGDTTSAQFQFASGASAALQAILYTPHFIRFHVFGHLAHVEVRNSTHPDTPGGVAEMVLTETGKPQVVETFDWSDTVRANVEAWAEAALHGAPYVHQADEMIHNIEVLAAVAEAGETGRTVAPRAFPDFAGMGC